MSKNVYIIWDTIRLYTKISHHSNHCTLNMSMRRNLHIIININSTVSTSHNKFSQLFMKWMCIIYIIATLWDFIRSEHCCVQSFSVNIATYLKKLTILELNIFIVIVFLINQNIFFDTYYVIFMYYSEF